MRRLMRHRIARCVRLAPCSIALLASLPAASAAGDASASAFDWGCRLRVRQEYLANAYDFSEGTADDSNYLRVRSQLWGSWAPVAGWKLFAMLNNEHRHWFKSTKGLEDADFEINELIVENLYVEGKKLGGTPIGFTLGRQNIMYGEGFLCWDGGPLDGSRTAYFNALLVNAVFDKRRIEAHVLSDPAHDEYLPVVNDQDQKLVERKESGAGLYYTDESVAGRKLEAYYFFKRESESGAALPGSDIHTIGARASGTLERRWTFALEGALQLGDRGDQDRVGYGGYATLWYETAGFGRPFHFGCGGVMLSGDDPRTLDRYEGWNPLYARWPKWSELMVYTLAGEAGVSYWQNLGSAWIGAKVEPAKRFFLEGRYHFMWAPEPNPLSCDDCGPNCTRVPRVLCMDDDFSRRGDLSIVKAGVNWSRNVSGYLLWEALRPGVFDTHRTGGSDTAHFLRWEIILSY